MQATYTDRPVNSELYDKIRAEARARRVRPARPVTVLESRGVGAAAEMVTDLSGKALWQLERIISADWRKPYFGAVPYLEALGQLDSINDTYGADDARGVVAYLLGNLQTWRGPVARAVKAELKRRLAR